MDLEQIGEAMLKANGPTGVWIGYQPDGSDFAVFASELMARRFAMEHSGMLVTRLPFEKSLHDYLNDVAAARMAARQAERRAE
jgi:hypothetical protein